MRRKRITRKGEYRNKTLKKKENQRTKIESSFTKNLIDIEYDCQELEGDDDEKNDKSFYF